MSKWQEFENECCNYLNKTYGTEKVAFRMTGGSDSHAPDIEAHIDGVCKFNIEVKSHSAQSGQFVVLEENGRFVFSGKNKSDGEDALPILEYMNDNFNKYKSVSTAGVALEMDKKQYINWVVKHYLSKNERFVITKQGANFVLFPIEKYGQYFETTAKYRIKKSGSQDVPCSCVDDLKNFFLSFDEGASLLFNGKKLYVATKNSMNLRERFFLDEKEFFVSAIDDGILYIRKLSNTRNANVIFSIKLKMSQNSADLRKFEEALK